MKSSLPENRSARLVVTLERFGIILPLVAEDAAESRGVLFVSEEPVPIVVADLVPKMSKDGPVGFIQLHAPPFPFGVVCFGKIYGNDSEVMSGHYRRPG